MHELAIPQYIRMVHLKIYFHKCKTEMLLSEFFILWEYIFKIHQACCIIKAYGLLYLLTEMIGPYFRILFIMLYNIYFNLLINLVMEMTGPKFRIHLGMLYHIWFAVGFAMLPGIAYAIRDHIKLQVVLGLLPFMFLSLYL